MNAKNPGIIFLDAYTTNPGDLDWSILAPNQDVQYYDRTVPKDIISRAYFAEIIIVNKVAISGEILNQLPNLKCICVAATGYDRIDTAAAAKRNIPVFNVRGYSSDSVAERVFAFMLHHTQNLDTYFKAFRDNVWSMQDDFCYWFEPIYELKNKTLGIIGLGSIGSRVDEIAQVFGMDVLYTGRNKKVEDQPYRKFVELPELLANSDFISLHLPLNKRTTHLVNASFLSAMKSTAVLINTSRGEIVNESSLAKALQKKIIRAAYLDVLSQEPPSHGHVLSGIAHCFVSPHTAWASLEARTNLLKGIRKNIEEYKIGNWSTALNIHELLNIRNS